MLVQTLRLFQPCKPCCLEFHSWHLFPYPVGDVAILKKEDAANSVCRLLQSTQSTAGWGQETANRVPGGQGGKVCGECGKGPLETF